MIGRLVSFVCLAAAIAMVLAVTRRQDLRAMWREGSRLFVGLLAGVIALGLVVQLLSRG